MRPFSQAPSARPDASCVAVETACGMAIYDDVIEIMAIAWCVRFRLCDLPGLCRRGTIVVMRDPSTFDLEPWWRVIVRHCPSVRQLQLQREKGNREKGGEKGNPGEKGKREKSFFAFYLASHKLWAACPWPDDAALCPWPGGRGPSRS
jgi:hypothetical protein